jgi:hypothetical protein
VPQGVGRQAPAHQLRTPGGAAITPMHRRR